MKKFTLLFTHWFTWTANLIPPPDMTCAGEIPFFMVHMTGKKHARGRRRGVRYKVSVVI